MSSETPALAGTRILETPGRASALILPNARLRVSAGPDAGLELELGQACLVGTSAECDLVLNDDAVSARHFEVLASEDGYLLRDVGAKNGTMLNGCRVLAAYLPQQATITVGLTKIEFSIDSGEKRVALSRSTNFGELLGHSAAMRSAFLVLDVAAKSESTVLVLGESGTGKELAARAVHRNSARANGPYVVFDCGAASSTLVESQLFGHAKGAFTGATESRAGAFESAARGTLVLDEIGELSLDLQPKLLRALEARTVQRLGETHPRDVDVRFIACTHRNLEEDVRAGRFRQDLFYRLSVLTARLPPLRQRKEEIPRLLAHFASQLSDEEVDVPSHLMALLHAHDWPGNVRELRNFVERFLAMPGVGVQSLLPGAPDAVAPPSSHDDAEVMEAFHEAKKRWTERFETNYLERLLKQHRGNISAAARAAGLSRQSCYRLMQKHGLDV